MAEALEGGAGKAHKFTKGKAGSGLATELVVDGQLTADPILLMKGRQDQWGNLWNRDKEQLPTLLANIKELRQQAKSEQLDMPAIGLHDIDRGLRKFKAFTSTSIDLWAPCELKAVSDEGKVALAGLLNRCEKECAYPAQAMGTVIGLMPKPKGGERPIGILPTLQRLHTAIRAPWVSAWETGYVKHWDGAVRGSSALRAALARLVDAELAASQGLEVAAILWDAEKFFDSLDLNVLIKVAREQGFSATVLAMAATTYAQVRFLRCGEAYSEGTDVANSIVAGCRFANLMAKFTLYLVVGQAHIQHPAYGPTQYVDDMAQQGTGTFAQLAMGLSTAAIDLILHLLRVKVKISIKSTVVASSKALADIIVKRVLAATGIQLTQALEARDLGATYSAAKYRPSSGFKKRVAATLNRVKKNNNLSKLSVMGHIKSTGNKVKVLRAAKLFSAGSRPQATYGVQACGATRAEREHLRAMAVTAAGATPPGSCPVTAVRLAYPVLEDPWIRLPVDILCEWVHFWSRASQDTQRSIYKFWAKTKVLLADPSSRWRQVRGFASAVIATVMDLGMKPISPVCWGVPGSEDEWHITGRGSVAVFKKDLASIMDKAAWATASLHRHGDGLQEGAVLHGPKKHLRYLQTKGLGSEYTMLATTLAGGVWTGERCRQEGMEVEGLCPACGTQPDTEEHRLWFCECNLTDQDPRIQRTNGLVPAGRASYEKRPAVWIRGLPAAGDYDIPEPMDEGQIWKWGSPPAPTEAGTTWWGDGSGGAHTKDPRLRRCGYGAVAYHTSGNQLIIDCALAATLAGATQTVPRAELAALLLVSRVSAGPTTYVTDCWGSMLPGPKGPLPVRTRSMPTSGATTGTRPAGGRRLSRSAGWQAIPRQSRPCLGRCPWETTTATTSLTTWPAWGRQGTRCLSTSPRRSNTSMPSPGRSGRGPWQCTSGQPSSSPGTSSTATRLPRSRTAGTSFWLPAGTSWCGGQRAGSACSACVLLLSASSMRGWPASPALQTLTTKLPNLHLLRRRRSSRSGPWTWTAMRPAQRRHQVPRCPCCKPTRGSSTSGGESPSQARWRARSRRTSRSTSWASCQQAGRWSWARPPSLTPTPLASGRACSSAGTAGHGRQAFPRGSPSRAQGTSTRLACTSSTASRGALPQPPA